MQSLEEKWKTVSEIVPHYMTVSSKATNVQRNIRRWIETGVLAARKATVEETALLVATGRVKGIPPEGIYLIDEGELVTLDIRRHRPGFPKGQKRPKKGTKTGAGTPER